MIIKLLDRYLNLALVREITFDGESTTLVFDDQQRESIRGDFREFLRKLTSGTVVTAANAADFKAP